jgi:hypothetical protein
MLSPTIREELGRLRQIELARAAERRGRLVTAPQLASARRAISALLAVVLRRPWASSTDGRPTTAESLGEPFVSFRVLGSEAPAPLSRHRTGATRYPARRSQRVPRARARTIVIPLGVPETLSGQVHGGGPCSEYLADAQNGARAIGRQRRGWTWPRR